MVLDAHGGAAVLVDDFRLEGVSASTCHPQRHGGLVALDWEDTVLEVDPQPPVVNAENGPVQDLRNTPADVSGRGPLFPAELPMGFTRIPAGPVAQDLVSWWWISTWSIPSGQQSPQELLAFPASNLVFEDDDLRYWGPTTRRSTHAT